MHSEMLFCSLVVMCGFSARELLLTGYFFQGDSQITLRSGSDGVTVQLILDSAGGSMMFSYQNLYLRFTLCFSMVVVLHGR